MHPLCSSCCLLNLYLHAQVQVYPHALVGLLLSQDPEESMPSRLLAQVVQAEQIDDGSGRRMAVELSFPEQVMDRQRPKIRNLLRTLQ